MDVAVRDAGKLVQMWRKALKAGAGRLRSGRQHDFVCAVGHDVRRLERRIEQDLHLKPLELAFVPIEEIEDLPTAWLQPARRNWPPSRSEASMRLT